MLKRSFWLAIVVAPLCLMPACELVSDAVRQGGLNGGHGDGDVDGMEPHTPYDDDEAKGGDPNDQSACVPIDGNAVAECMDPRWEDSDHDGCIDHFACADYTGDVDPTQCEPFAEELFANCANPFVEDSDDDGCLDSFVCLDEDAEPVGGPDDDEPTMCKPLPDTSDCADPHFEDRDADGCIDLYACLDSYEPKPMSSPTSK